MQGNLKRIHFVGIGGAGMSGIATVLLGLGYRVSGSDAKYSAVLERLQRLGAICYVGHEAGQIDRDIDTVVISTAISPDNPEVLAANRLGIPLVKRGEMLARLMQSKRGIAVAGAHGKTTTTSMTALVLEENGLDPTILIGGDLSKIGGNAKLGRGELLLAEADESDGSFLLLEPQVAVVTNIEDDHLDYYGSQERLTEAFRSFLNKVPQHGVAVICLDDPVLKQMRGSLTCPLITYGSQDAGADYVLHALKGKDGFNCGEVYYRGEKLGTLALQVPGHHNLLNALAAVAVGRYLGLTFTQITKALRTFQGAKRRFQLIGEAGGVRVVDDYAHHPTEVKATLQAAISVHPGRIIAVFQPHRYSRTRQLYREFGQSFGQADLVVFTDIYAASEQPIEGVHTKLIIDAMPKKAGQRVVYLPGLAEVADFLANEVRQGDLVLTMGAGDIYTLGRALLKRLEEK